MSYTLHFACYKTTIKQVNKMVHLILTILTSKNIMRLYVYISIYYNNNNNNKYIQKYNKN